MRGRWQITDAYVGAALGALGSGLGSTLTTWASTGDPRAFGQSFGGTLALAGAAAAPFAAGEAAAADAGASSLTNCFVAGTLVQMADGSTKPIEQVKTGDQVASRPEEEARDASGSQSTTKSHATKTSRVARAFVHNDAVVLQLHLESGETITTTPGHPFVVAGEGFVQAGRLAIGNAIVTRAGPSVKIVGIEHLAEQATVYNFEVEGTHTYFVGETNSGIWVHNQLLFPLTSPLMRPSVEPQAAVGRPSGGDAPSLR